MYTIHVQKGAWLFGTLEWQIHNAWALIKHMLELIEQVEWNYTS